MSTITSALLPLKKLVATRNRKILVTVILLIVGFLVLKRNSNKTATPTYQTATAEKGTLITTITASGNITSSGDLTISTDASGIVNKVYVKNGDLITKGQRIADLTLDQDSLQRHSQAWASYLSAKNSLTAAQAKINSLQAAEFKANQTFMLDAVARELATNDPVYIQENALWLQAEADYKNQTAIIAQSQAALSSAWYSYQQTTPTITAPTSGIITGLVITPGLVLTSTTNSNTSTVSSQKIGTISSPDKKPQAQVSISEIDSPKIIAGQKATLTLDAFPDKTFTGKVMIIDTNGQVSSGVTIYPATIIFDTAVPTIYPNMAVDAKIITDIKDNVVLVPTAAVQTTNGQSMVRVMKNGQITPIAVTTGSSNDTQIEIVSGINEGDEVVTSSSTGSTRTGQGGTSPFSALGGGNRGFGGGGGAVRIAR
jgi:RND family efflux transporter MFP subunit